MILFSVYIQYYRGRATQLSIKYKTHAEAILRTYAVVFVCAYSIFALCYSVLHMFQSKPSGREIKAMGVGGGISETRGALVSGLHLSCTAYGVSQP